MALKMIMVTGYPCGLQTKTKLTSFECYSEREGRWINNVIKMVWQWFLRLYFTYFYLMEVLAKHKYWAAKIIKVLYQVITHMSGTREKQLVCYKYLSKCFLFKFVMSSFHPTKQLDCYVDQFPNIYELLQTSNFISIWNNMLFICIINIWAKVDDWTKWMVDMSFTNIKLSCINSRNLTSTLLLHHCQKS